MRSKTKRWYQVPFVTALLIALGMQFTYIPKSEALIGVIFKSRTVKTIGGIGALGGGVVTGYGWLVAGSATELGGLFGGAIIMSWGVVLAGLGIVILDDNRVADIEFRPIDLSDAANYEGFTRFDAEIYNSEIELLNAVRQRIVRESGNDSNTVKAEKLWLKYEKYLSPETFAIAKAKAKVFVEAL